MQKIACARPLTCSEIYCRYEDGSDLVEVKSKLNLEAVDDLLADLAQFTDYFPSYRGYDIYGAVAGLHITESVDRYAYRRVSSC